LHNARIHTLDPRHLWVEAVALRDGLILATGSSHEILPLAAADTECIDLEGRLILPGLCDAHIHMHEWALNQQQLDFSAAKAKSEMLAAIAETVAHTAPGVWITGQGWNESWWGEYDFPTAADLDTVAGQEHPVLFWRSDHHIAVVNSAALQAAGITAQTEPPAGGVIDRDAAGNPTGILRELAAGLVAKLIPEASDRELDALIQTATRGLHALGITAVHDQRIKDGSEGPRMLAAYQRLRRRDNLRLRVNCNIAAHQLGELAALGLQAGFGDDLLRLGHIKVFADGSLGSRTAWMLEPFVKHPATGPTNLGVSVTPPDQMAAEFRRAAELGFPISIHAIGDRANRVVLDIFEEMVYSTPPLPFPHRIEHVQTINPEDLPRLARLDITASVQPLHAPDDRDVADRFLGARTGHTYAFRSLLDAGTRLAFGSDAPVANPNPWWGLYAALQRTRIDSRRPPWHPEQAISLASALHAYTLGAAEASGWARTIGSITPGKRADLIVLDQDIIALAGQPETAAQIAQTTVLITIFDGAIVYRHANAPF
jgi:predicted amidohydrolase YtcJ